MKTKLLITVCLLTSIFVQAQTTVTIPDDAFEAYLETEFASNIVSDGSITDGSITFTDIDLITDIDFPTAGVTTVTDMTGINQFPELKNLYCNDNAITGTIDLTGLTKLTNMYCFNNPGLTEINFSGCEKIYHVKAYNCGLTTLDISMATTGATDNTRLRYLYANDNSLTSANFSGYIALYRIDLYDNMLTSIDINGITTLTYLRINNNMISGDIDVSANLGLEKLGLYGNEVSSINLGAIPYSSFNYFKISSNANLTCVFTDNPTDYIIGGTLDTAIGSNYSVDATTNFVIDQAACNALSTNENAISDFKIYPNPITNYVNVVAQNNSTYHIYNTTGQLVQQGNLTIGLNTINTYTMNPGLYLLHATTTSGATQTIRLVKN